MNEIGSVKSNVVNNLDFICVEDVFDFDAQTLKIIKEEIERRLKEENSSKELEECNYDEDSFSDTMSGSSPERRNRNLKKLYSFVVSEIKERGYYDDILEFFMNDQINTVTSKYIAITDSKEIITSISDGSKEQEIYLSDNNRFNNKDDEKHNFNPSSIYPLNKKLKQKIDIKSILAKTRLDDGVKFLVGQSTLKRNIKTANTIATRTTRALPLIEDRNLFNKTSKREQKTSLLTTEAFYYHDNINYKRNKSLVSEFTTMKIQPVKKKVKIKRNISHDENTNYEKRRNYIVPNIKKYLINNLIEKKEKCLPKENKNFLLNLDIPCEEKKLKVEDVDELGNGIAILLTKNEDCKVHNDSMKNLTTEVTENVITDNSSDRANVIATNLEYKKEMSVHEDSTNLLINDNKLKEEKFYLEKEVSSNENFQIIEKKIIDKELHKILNEEFFICGNNLCINKGNDIQIKEDICVSSDFEEKTRLNDKNKYDESKQEEYLQDQNACKVSKDEEIENLLIEKENLYQGVKIDSDVIRANIEKLYENTSGRKNINLNSKTPMNSNQKTKPHNVFSLPKTPDSIAPNGFLVNNFNQTVKSKTHSTTNFFNLQTNKKLILNERTKSSKIMIQERSKSSKMPLLKHISKSLASLPDYSKIYSNFNEIFSGYFLNKEINYSSKQFDIYAVMATLNDSFKNMRQYEMHDAVLNKTNSKTFLEAEEAMRENRLIKVSNKLLTDRNLDEKGFYILKKILEIGKKENNLVDYNTEEQIDRNKRINNKKYFRVVLSRPEIYDIVCYTLSLREQWSELPHGLSLGNCWNLLWTYSTPSIDIMKLFSFQKVNHLINNRVLSRKDLLKKAIDRVRKISSKLNKYFDIMPTTFILCKDYLDFLDEFMRVKNSLSNPLHNLWIVKPVGKSRGRGIFLINDIAEVPMADGHLVQKYLNEPLLIDGYKFDMRIYVLVTSVNPLEAFIYKDGFARMSSYRYSINNIDRLVHLTNAAIQNSAAKVFINDDYEKLYGGSKISLDMLKNKLMQMGVNFDNIIWNQIKDIVLKSLIACQYDIPFCPSTFELFGYDIIIDRNLKCWLLEVNSSPSLARTSVLDDMVKLKLVEDCLNVVDPIDFDLDELIVMLERRMNITRSDSSNTYLYSPTIQLNLDLNKVFKGKIPRAFGEVPEKLGNFEVIAPSNESDKIIKLTGGQKMYANKNK